MLTIDGVAIPADVLSAADECEDVASRDALLTEYVRAQGGVAPTKDEARAQLHPLVAKLQDKLADRVTKAKAAREQQQKRNAELAQKNAPAKRGAAKPAASPSSTTQGAGSVAAIKHEGQK